MGGAARSSTGISAPGHPSGSSRAHASEHDRARGSSSPRVWILQSTGAGANRQLCHLAEALGEPYAFKRTLDGLPWVLLDRLNPPAWRRIPARKQNELHEPWPELVLFSGGRSTVDALRIRALSGGRCRLVCIGRPWAPLHWFDRVIVTPQYGLPDHPSVLQITLPLSGNADDTASATDRWRATWTHLPRPWIGVLLGGNSGSYRFTTPAARDLGRRIDERARALGGAALITSSARTPPEALEALLAEVRAPHYCYRWHDGDGDNPIQGILALADCFIVTADSASMPAEACATGRPVASYSPPLRWRSGLLSRFRMPAGAGRLRNALQGLRRRLIIHGLWIPARDMSRVHAVLASQELIRPIAELNTYDRGGSPLADDMERAVASVRALWPVQSKPRAGPS